MVRSCWSAAFLLWPLLWCTPSCFASGPLPQPGERVVDGSSERRPSPTASDHPFESLERQVHQRVNAYRRERGLSPLSYDPRIASLAREHSRAMAAGVVSFGHSGFEERKEAASRIVDWRRIAENVGFNDYLRSATVDVAVDGWLDSARHRENIEGPFESTGIGVAKDGQGTYYYTQIFVTLRD